MYRFAHRVNAVCTSRTNCLSCLFRRQHEFADHVSAPRFSPGTACLPAFLAYRFRTIVSTPDSGTVNDRAVRAAFLPQRPSAGGCAVLFMQDIQTRLQLRPPAACAPPRAIRPDRCRFHVLIGTRPPASVPMQRPTDVVVTHFSPSDNNKRFRSGHRSLAPARAVSITAVIDRSPTIGGRQ